MIIIDGVKGASSMPVHSEQIDVGKLRGCEGKKIRRTEAKGQRGKGGIFDAGS